MYILKNVLTSIKRNKGRNILIRIVVFVIACTATVALSISNSANQLISSYKSQYEVSATIGVNRGSLMGGFRKEDSDSIRNVQEKFSNIGNLTEEQVNLYGESEYVKSYYYLMSIRVNSNELEATSSMEPIRGGKGFSNPIDSGDFTLTGYSTLEAMTEFIEGTYTMIEGEVDTDFSADSCLINYELATLNDIQVGDVITLVDVNDSSITYALTVVGIFQDNDIDSETSMNLFSNSSNTIMTTATVISKILSLDDTLTASATPTFYLTSSDVVESFEAELIEKGMSEYLTLSTNLDQIDSATKSISNVKNFVMSFLVITLIVGSIVLIVINMINVRERKYEIGVLRTIGMKKSLVSLQFMTELFIVAVVFLTLGTLTGSCLSVPTANALLQQEIENSETATEQIRNNFGGMKGSETMPLKNIMNLNGVIKVEPISSIHAIVDLKVILELLIIGISLALISSVASMVIILKFSPLEILKERS